MKKKWVIIRIETKVREFYSKTMLAYHLISKGYGVIFENEMGGHIERFPKGLYLINSLYKNTYPRVVDIAKKGNIIQMLDEEGLVMINKERYLSRIDSKSLEYLNKFMCYGENQYDLLTEAFPNDRNKFVITGNPRLNLLNTEFHKIENSDNEDLKDSFGEYILIVSNFSLVNNYGFGTDKKSRYESIRNIFDEMELIKNIDDFNGHFEHSNLLFESFMDLARILSTKFPNNNIIVRPHPSENPKMWKKIAEKSNNIHIIHKGSLNEWIKSSKIVIQNSCTSAIESLYLNKSCISYRPVKSEIYDQPLPNKLSVNVDNINEVVELVDRAIKEEDIFKSDYENFKRLAEYYIAYQDADESVQEIIKCIESNDFEEYHFNELVFKMSKYKIKNIYKQINKLSKIKFAKTMHKLLNFFNLTNGVFYSFIDKKIKIYDTHLKSSANKVSKIETYEIEDIFYKLNGLYDRDNNFNVKKLEGNVFVMTNLKEK